MTVIKTRVLVLPLSPRQRRQKLLDVERVEGYSLFASPATALGICFSLLVGYPKWKVRCSTAAVSPSKYWSLDIDPRGLSGKYDRW